MMLVFYVLPFLIQMELPLLKDVHAIQDGFGIPQILHVSSILALKIMSTILYGRGASVILLLPS